MLCIQASSVTVLPISLSETVVTNNAGYIFSLGDTVTVDASKSYLLLLEASQVGLVLFKRDALGVAFASVALREEVGIKGGVINPSGKTAAVRYEAGGVTTLKIFDVSALKLDNSYNADIPANITVTAMDFLGDDKLIVGLSNGKVASLTKNSSTGLYSVWNEAQHHSTAVLSISAEDTVFVSTSEKKVIWGTLSDSQAIVLNQTHERSDLTFAALSPVGNRILIGSTTGNV